MASKPMQEMCLKKESFFIIQLFSCLGITLLEILSTNNQMKEKYLHYTRIHTHTQFICMYIFFKLSLFQDWE